MIFSSVLHQMHSFDASRYVFQQSALMYDLKTSGSVALEASSSDGKQRQTNAMVLSWRAPNQISGSFTHRGKSQQFFVDKFASVTYRPELKQYISIKKDEKVSIRQAALIAEPKLDPLVLAFTEPGETAKFYKDFANLPGWKAAVKNGLIHLTTKVSDIEYKAAFRADDFSLAHLWMKRNGLVQEWKLKPGPGLKTFEPRRDDAKVAVFREQFAEPKYADRSAQAVVAKMFKAFDRPSWLAFEISDPDENTKVLLEGLKMRQTDSQADFYYDGTTTAVWDKGGNTFYEGRAKSSEMQEAVVAAGTRLDPIVRDLVHGMNPFRRLLSEPGTKVKVSMKTRDRSGQPVTLIEAKSEMRTINIAVRDADGKVLSILSNLTGSSGDSASSQRTFTYLPKSAVESADAFSISPPQGVRRVPVSDIVARR